MVLAFCISSDGLLSMYQISFLIPFYTFRDLLRTSFFLQKNIKVSNSVNFGDWVMPVPAFCTSSDGPLSMHQVSINSLLYFPKICSGQVFIAKIKKGK